MERTAPSVPRIQGSGRALPSQRDRLPRPTLQRDTWHFGPGTSQLFHDPMYDTTRRETFQFWRTITQHFAGKSSTVAFYELFNEPTLFRGQLGSMSWSEWKKLNEDNRGQGDSPLWLLRAHPQQEVA